jgi:hypothetical protein
LDTVCRQNKPFIGDANLGSFLSVLSDNSQILVLPFLQCLPPEGQSAAMRRPDLCNRFIPIATVAKRALHQMVGSVRSTALALAKSFLAGGTFAAAVVSGPVAAAGSDCRE